MALTHRSSSATSKRTAAARTVELVATTLALTSCAAASSDGQPRAPKGHTPTEGSTRLSAHASSGPGVAGRLLDLSKVRKGDVFTVDQLDRLDAAAARRAGTVTTTKMYRDDALSQDTTLVTYVDCSHKKAFVQRDDELLVVEREGKPLRDPDHVVAFATVSDACSPPPGKRSTEEFVVTATDDGSVTLTRRQATGHPERIRLVRRYARTEASDEVSLRMSMSTWASHHVLPMLLDGVGATAPRAAAFLAPRRRAAPSLDNAHMATQNRDHSNRSAPIATALRSPQEPVVVPDTRKGPHHGVLVNRHRRHRDRARARMEQGPQAPRDSLQPRRLRQPRRTALPRRGSPRHRPLRTRWRHGAGEHPSGRGKQHQLLRLNPSSASRAAESTTPLQFASPSACTGGCLFRPGFAAITTAPNLDGSGPFHMPVKPTFGQSPTFQLIVIN